MDSLRCSHESSDLRILHQKSGCGQSCIQQACQKYPLQKDSCPHRRELQYSKDYCIGAHHLCEHNNDHITFTAKSTGKEYMEGHHLIPLKYQNEFDCGIDVYANIVCLCPICHRLLHFGTDDEKTYAAEKLFDERKERLINSGIDISKREFLELVI